MIKKNNFVKLHSELADPTELQLDGVGVDIVFPCQKNNNNNNNQKKIKSPHLDSTRRNGPISLKFGGIPVGV